MTVINILNNDFEILFEDEKDAGAVAGLKVVRRKLAGASTNSYTTNQLYSAIADAADEFIAMGFENPMLPVTPNAYTMENAYFIPRSSTEFLDEGAIDADWAVTSGVGVYFMTYTGTGPVDADIGKQVIEAGSGDSGTLLDYETLPNGTFAVWIRPDVADDTFDTTGALSVSGGTMATTNSSVATSGRSLYSSIQVIGSVPTATEVYLYQDRAKMTDSTGGFQWWATDTAVSLGIIDILIRVENAGVSVADGDVEVFSRRYTSLYDNFRLNIAAGGRSALPLASATDINNTTGYRTSGTLAGITGTFDVGNGIYVGGTWLTATVKGIITATNGNTELEYYLVGDLTDFSNTQSVQEYDFAAVADGDADATTGTVALNLTGPTDSASGEGGTVVIAIGTVTADHDGDNAQEPYSVEVDALTLVSAAKVYERLKYVTRRGADEADLFGAGTNIPGESYRGLEALYEYDANTGTMIEGDDINNDAGALAAWTGRLMAQNTTNSPTYITVTDQQTSLESVANDDLVEDETGDDITVHSGGTLGFQSITSPKSSPFGTFTGTQIFGARGVLFSNPLPVDAQNYILTDDLGNLKNPPNTIAFTVTNTAAGDRILVARDNGTAGIIDKAQYGNLSAPAASYNRLADVIIRVTGNVDTAGNDTPSSGFIRVVETTLQQEHHYVYDSITLGANDEFNLRPISGGTITTGGVPTLGVATLTDTGATFQTDAVTVGMLVRNTFAGKTTQVWEVQTVSSETALIVKQLYGILTAAQDWDVSDTYVINTLIGNHTTPTDYATTDNVYTPLIDAEATTTSISNTFVKTLASDFGVVINVRQGKTILPFTQNTTQTDGSTTVTVVRTPDTIAT